MANRTTSMSILPYGGLSITYKFGNKYSHAEITITRTKFNPLHVSPMTYYFGLTKRYHQQLSFALDMISDGAVIAKHMWAELTAFYRYCEGRV